MKRSSFKPRAASLKRTPFLSKPKQMKKVSKKKQAHAASAEGKEMAWYRGQVLDMPCIICKLFDLPQQSRTTGHHAIHRRYSTRKRDDYSMLPICEGHHQGDFDTSKVAVHREPARWRELYGDDVDYCEMIQLRILGYTIPDPCDNLSDT